jgi:NADH-quinone oxidoreductase subunit N
MQLLPEIVVCGGVIVAFLLSLSNTITGERVRRYMLVWGVVVIAAALYAHNESALLFAGSYRVDAYSQFFKMLIGIGLFANALLGWPLRSIPRTQSPEYYLFFYSAGLGMMLLSSVYNFLVLYLSMELVSYSMYVMIGMRRDRTESIESTVKYFLIGAASSAIGLYGVTLIYGAIGGLGFSDMIHALQGNAATVPMLEPGLVMVFSSFLFKLAAFPFHVWAPDAYDAAASPVAMFLSSVGKLAGIAALFRIVFIANPLLPRMGIALGIIAILTMSYGNFVAFRQKSVKRLFAYSSIAQAGYIILGMLGLATSAPQAILYYSVIYLLMNLALFMVTIELEQKAPDPQIEGFRGLHQRAPLMALTLMIVLFSLAGVPPLAGFFGKWLLFSSAMEAGYTVLVALAILNSVISLFYYLFLVKAAYYGDPREKFRKLESRPVPTYAAVVISLAVLVLGAYPQPLMAYIISLDLPRVLMP